MGKNINRAVYIVNIGEPEYSQYCINSWKYWAKRNDVDVYVLTEGILPAIDPHWYKILPFRQIEADQIAVVDNDTMIMPQTSNFFDIIQQGQVGAVIDDSNYDWIIRSVELYGYELFSDIKLDIFNYFNSGFLVLGKEHEEKYEQIIQFLSNNHVKLDQIQRTYGVGRDQTPLNYLYKKFNIPVQYLSARYNLQNIKAKEIVDPKRLSKITYIVHYNSMPKEHRTVFMKQMWEYHESNLHS